MAPVSRQLMYGTSVVSVYMEPSVAPIFIDILCMTPSVAPIMYYTQLPWIPLFTVHSLSLPQQQQPSPLYVCEYRHDMLCVCVCVCVCGMLR